jgi:hypothetical protein
MNTDTKQIETKDYFAALALQALITKFPLLDSEKEFGEGKSEDEINAVKKELCEAAYNYAWHMMTARESMAEYFTHFKNQQP